MIKIFSCVVFSLLLVAQGIYANPVADTIVEHNSASSDSVVVDVNSSVVSTDNSVDENSTLTNRESNFSKASLPMKAFYIVAVPVVMIGAIVSYVVVAPFALAKWALTPKK